MSKIEHPSEIFFFDSVHTNILKGPVRVKFDHMLYET